MSGPYDMNGEEQEGLLRFFFEHYKRREHFEDLDVDGRIIIIIYHNLGFDRLVYRPRMIISSKVFQDVFNLLVYNSA